MKDGWHDSVTLLERAQSQNEVFGAIHDGSPVHLTADDQPYLGYTFETDCTPRSKTDSVTVNTDTMKHQLDEAYFNYQLTKKLLASLEEVASVPPHPSKKDGEAWAALRLTGDEVGLHAPISERKTVEDLQALSVGLMKWIQEGNENLKLLNQETSHRPAAERAPAGFAYNTLYQNNRALPVLPGKYAYQIHLASYVLLADTRTTVQWQINQERSKERNASLFLSITFLLGWAASSVGKFTGEDDLEGDD